MLKTAPSCSQLVQELHPKSAVDESKIPLLDEELTQFGERDTSYMEEVISELEDVGEGAEKERNAEDHLLQAHAHQQPRVLLPLSSKKKRRKSATTLDHEARGEGGKKEDAGSSLYTTASNTTSASTSTSTSNSSPRVMNVKEQKSSSAPSCATTTARTGENYNCATSNSNPNSSKDNLFNLGPQEKEDSTSSSTASTSTSHDGGPVNQQDLVRPHTHDFHAQTNSSEQSRERDSSCSPANGTANTEVGAGALGLEQAKTSNKNPSALVDVSSISQTAKSMDCKYVWVWKVATCHANSGSCKNLCCMNAKSCPLSTKLPGSFSCRIGMVRLGVGIDLTESVMLGAALQTTWIMENLHDKSRNYLPDPDIVAFDKERRRLIAVARFNAVVAASGPCRHRGRAENCILCKSIVLVVIAVMHYKFLFQVKSALQILFLMLRKFVMRFILVRCFYISYTGAPGAGSNPPSAAGQQQQEKPGAGHSSSSTVVSSATPDASAGKTAQRTPTGPMTSTDAAEDQERTGARKPVEIRTSAQTASANQREEEVAAPQVVEVVPAPTSSPAVVLQQEPGAVNSTSKTTTLHENKQLLNKQKVLRQIGDFPLPKERYKKSPKCKVSTAKMSGFGRVELVMLFLDSKKICIS